MSKIFELVFLIICTGLVIFGFLISSKRSRFLLAAAVMTIAWQGGYWLEIFKMDFTLTYFIFAILFLWNFLTPQQRFQLRGRFPMLIYFWLGVTVFCLLAVMPAIDKYAALGGVARAVLSVIIFFAALKSLRSARDVQFFVGALMAAMLFQGLLAMLQFKFPDFKIGVIDESQSWMWWRAKGTFFHANEMGMYLLLMLPITARVFISALMRGNRPWTYFAGGAFMIGGFAFFATFNRGSWVGFAAGIMFMLCYDLYRSTIKLKKIILGLSVPATILIIIFAIKYGPTFVDRLFYSDASDMLEGRLQYQQESLTIIKANPIIGVGYWNYINHVNTYFVHNLYLLVASEIGIPGLVFMAGFLLTLFSYIIKGMRSKIFFISNLSRGCFASFVGFLLASIPGPDFWISHPVQIYFWMIVALQVALLRLEQRAREQLRRQKQRSQKEIAAQLAGGTGLSTVPILERKINNRNSISDLSLAQYGGQE